ncbi:MAG: zinc dependent phospholipase C family protein [Eubacterium sp.]|nr:zinc dependent phospholipase C family protein [Eubacterium sp.]
MPGFISHHLFGHEIYLTITDKDVANSIRKFKNVYNLGLQGPDIFYYNIGSYLKIGKNPGNSEHHQKTDEFLLNLARSASLFDSREDYECAMSYLAGFYAHYTLDKICHPFIFARTYYKFKDDKNYLGLHYQYETDIDALYLKRSLGIVPSEFKADRNITISFDEAQIVNKILLNAHSKTYGKLSIKKNEAERAAYSMKKILPLLSDPHGIKKFILGGIEKAIFGSPYLSAMITSDYEIRFKGAENLSHENWKSPWEPDKVRHESFYELKDLAITDYQRLMPLLSALMRHEAEITEATAEHFH